MRPSRFTEEQIIGMLKEQEAGAKTAVEFATLEWVDWFNHRRLMGPISDMPPAEAEERYYAMLDEPAMAA
jgi:hypothetical protein